MRLKKCFLILLCIFLCMACVSLAEDGAYTVKGLDGDGSTHDWATNKFFPLMERTTGVKLEPTGYTDRTKWQAEKDRMFSQNDLPDMLFKAELSDIELQRYLQSGQLIDLKPLLPQYAPNLWALLQAHPDWLSAITLPDGRIGALPTLNTARTQNAMWINQAWLDKLELTMPTTADELEKVLLAFKTGNPNGNSSEDEVPLTFLGAWDLKYLAHAFGLIANDYNVFVDEAGKVQYLAAQEEFYPFVCWLKKLNSEGLMASDGFTTADALRQITDDGKATVFGMLLGPTPMNLVSFKSSSEFVLLPPLTCDGKQVYRDLYGEVMRGTFAITSACRSPETLLGWVDTLYTEAGGRIVLAGEETVDYTIAEDGTWKWNVSDEDLSYMLADTVLYTTGNTPWLFPTDFYNRYGDENATRINRELSKLDGLAKRPFPYFTLTQEQRDTILPLQSALGETLDRWMSKAIIGEQELSEESYAALLNDLEQKGLSDFLAFWQGVADSYSEGAQQ